MRYVIYAVLASMLMLSGCSGYVTDGYNQEMEYNDPTAIQLALDDADIYVICEDTFAEQILEILFDPASFLGRTIRYRGEFFSFNWQDETIYFVGAASEGCCGLHGFEVYLNDIPPVDEHKWVEVTGVLEEIFDESFGYFQRLNLVSMTIVSSQPQVITAREAETMMDGENVVILDVRMPYEFEAGHIRNAVLLPLHELTEQIENIVPNKNYTILIYCRSGNRSNVAAHILAGMGYTAVYDFGGIRSWHGEVIK